MLRLRIAVIGGALALALGAVFGFGGPARSGVRAPASRGWSALPIAARLAVARGLGDQQSGFWVSRIGSALAARNARQRMAMRFTPAGAAVSTVGVRLGFSLSAVGHGSRLRRATVVAPVAVRNQAIYRRAGLTEWYANGPLGLEQGFTLSARPGSDTTGPLTLALALSGGLHARLAHGGGGMSFSRPDGRTVLRYGGLSVTDATGRALPSWLELRAGRLLIRARDGGARYPVTVDPYVETAKLTAADGAANDQMGWSVAISGNTVVAGAPNAMIAGRPHQGAVYVFVEPVSGWANATETAKLTASDGGASDALGTSVAISGDTIVAGAPKATVAGNPGQGAVYVFAKPPSGWGSGPQPQHERAKLSASDQETLGDSVAIDGGTVVAGASGASSNQGAVYLFVRPPSGWKPATETAKLTASNGVANDDLGVSVAVSGETVASGADQNAMAVTGPGAVYVFVKPSSGPWASATQTAELTASNGVKGDDLGHSVAVSGDTVVAGADGAKIGSSTATGQGAVYVFGKPSSGWGGGTQPQQESAKLTASDGADGDALGSSVAVSGDRVVASAPSAKMSQGVAYVFVRPTAGWAIATESAELVASDGAGADQFGSGVGIDGGTVMVGAPFGKVNGPSSHGAAYVFAVPAVTTAAASSVSQTRVGLNALVNPQGSTISDCHFDFGTSTSYGLAAPCTQSSISGSTPLSVSAVVSGLAPNTTYHFRAVATNALGTSYGGDMSFTTPVNAPAVATGQASGVTKTEGTMSGTVNPQGGAVSDCHFEWGTTSAYGNAAPCLPVPGAGTSDVIVSAALSGLRANTTYQFRVVATNAGGTGYGTDQSFTTVAYPPSVLTGRPSAVKRTHATFNGTVNPEGLVTNAHFEYGLDARYRPGGGGIVYDQSTPEQQVESNPGDHIVSAAVAGLVPNALYHTRLVATSAVGTVAGSDATFMTRRDPAPPRPLRGKRVNVQPVSGLVLIKIPLGASLDPHGAVNSGGFIPLTEPRRLPVGAQVNALGGTLRVIAANSGRGTRAAVLGGAVFSVRQARGGPERGVTEFALVPRPGCGARGTTQPLSVRAPGEFRTRGRFGTATALYRASWDTTDRCDGTLIVVHRGTVLVASFRRRGPVAVRRGGRYLAPAT